MLTKIKRYHRDWEKYLPTTHLTKGIGNIYKALVKLLSLFMTFYFLITLKLNNSKHKNKKPNHSPK